MGYGDEIIASGHAYKAYRDSHGKRVIITDRAGNPRWHELWEGLSFIVNPKKESFDMLVNDFAVIQNGGKCRPYIKYPFSVELGCTYSGWKCSDYPGRISFTNEELRHAANAVSVAVTRNNDKPLILIEPTLIKKANSNKQWGLSNWHDLVQLGKHSILFFQVGFESEDRLDDVCYIITPTFRHGAAVLSLMTASVLPEGGLAHAAGALHKPAVVLFGGAVDHITMGYPWHVRIADTGPNSPCGKWQECGHCKEIWSKLLPQQVLSKLRLLLDGTLP